MKIYHFRTLRKLLLLLLIVSVVPVLTAQANPEIRTRVVAREDTSNGPVLLRQLVDRLDHLWAIATLPGGGALITERPGRLLYLSSMEPGRGRLAAVAGVPDVYAVRQGGLLDIVVDPLFEVNRTVYLSYAVRVGSGSATRVARAVFPADPDAPRLENVEVIFTINTSAGTSHQYGARLAVDREGYLYVTVGDRGNDRSAQDRRNHQGSVIRINTDGSLPSDNPFADDGRGFRPEIYTWGHRNPQGIAVQPVSGQLWIHEHGPRGGDEINILVSGFNFGWPRVTGGVAYSGAIIAESPPPEGMVPPLLEWTPSIAPSGMAFVTHESSGSWRGDIVVGALAGRHLRRVDLAPAVGRESARVIGQETMFEGFVRFRDIQEGIDGYLYVLTDEDRGGLYRIEFQN